MDTAAAPRIEAHVWRIAIVVILGAIMSVLDTTIVNVALHSLSLDLHTSLASIQWVITGYLLALAAVIPVTGWAARRFGARRLYLIALVLFTAGSALCGLAWSGGSLIGFRVIQGIGGGMLMPIGQMTLVKAAGPRNLPRVMSAIGVPIVLAPVFGPTIGGLLLQHAGWQWIFMVNVPVGAFAFALALRLFPRDEPEQAGRLDALGLALAATGTVSITYGLSESAAAGSLLSSRVIVPVLIGLALVTAFVLRARRIEHPLLDVHLFSNRAFGAAALVTFCLGGALFGSMILMPLYFQVVRAQDAVATGLLLMPQGVGAAIGMGLSGRATERFGGGLTALGGGLLLAGATIPFALVGAATPFVLLAGAMVVRGIGMGLSMMPAMTAAFTVLERHQVNDATPQLTVLQRVGGSLGTAIIAVVLQSKLSGIGAHATRTAMASAFADTYLWVLAVSAVALLPTLLLVAIERRRRPAALVDEPLTAETALEVAA